MDMKNIYNEIDMLNGNINRMCVTDDQEELLKRYGFACLSLIKIYNLNSEKLSDRQDVKYICEEGDQ